MPEARLIAECPIGSVMAPAGHGKTEAIVKTAALGKRALILTHTHAGVHALRARLKRLGVPGSAAAVDTIAGWAMRYANAFPRHGAPPKGLPSNSAEWDQLYKGAAAVISIRAVREVIQASYDRILIDEYQDCSALQHDLAIALSRVVPTVIFGDPMQGIFEFTGATLPWLNQIQPVFPLLLELGTPRRWEGKNPDLGVWIAQTRDKLARGERIDLQSGPVNYREAKDAFDMSALFDGIDEREGTTAAIHCNRQICNQLGKATKGAFQAIEEIGSQRLRSFATAWDQAADGQARLAAFQSLLKDCFSQRDIEEGEFDSPDDLELIAELERASDKLARFNDIESVRSLLALSRRHPRWRVFRSELWRDTDRAMADLAAGRSATLTDAAAAVRQRTSQTGRASQKRTISTPLLLKGLEFDHVVIPDATHFSRERFAQAKLFYVAISRATRTLTIAAPSRFIQFSTPNT